MTSTITDRLTCCGTVWTQTECGECSRRVFIRERLSVNLPDFVLAALRRRATVDGFSVQEKVFELVLDYLEPKD